MAPRKPQTLAPALVRRVVRTVTTEEFIEQPPAPTLPPAPKKTITKSKPSAAANKSVRASAAVKKQPPKSTPAQKTRPNSTKATKQTNTKARQSKTPKPTPAKGAAKKVDPKKTPAKSVSLKTAAKKEEPNRTAAIASKRTPAKSVSSKAAATNKKSALGKATKAKTEATKTKGVKNERAKLTVQPAIKKKSVPKSARNNGKKNTAAASNAPAANGSLDEVKQLHAELYARMLNDAMQVARMEARAEMERLEEQRQASAGTGLNRSTTEPTPFSRPTPNPTPFASFSGQPSGAASLVVTPSIRARRVKQTARRTVLNTAPSSSARGTPSAQLAASSHDASRAVNSNEVWVLTHEMGYIPDGFHSSEPPRRQEAGTFANRSDAVKEGKRLVGDEVGYSWAEVCEGGDLEVVEDSSHKWEVCWSPPDSEFSRVVALRVKVSEGRWLVETESGYFPDGFHSYMAPTKKTLGPYQTREIAVGVGKRHVGRVYGISWDEVVSGGDLETVADSSTRWEVLWSPPDSEYSRVVVKLVAAAPSQTGRNNNTEDMEVEGDVDDDNYLGIYHTAAF